MLQVLVKSLTGAPPLNRLTDAVDLVGAVDRAFVFAIPELTACVLASA